jgi:hypothetical protein
VLASVLLYYTFMAIALSERVRVTFQQRRLIGAVQIIAVGG